MTDNNYTITPPPELVHQWHKIACKDPYNGGTFFDSKVLKSIATQAARWGADQELEACCKWLQDPDLNVDTYKLRAARRPEPSLVEQALMALERWAEDEHGPGAVFHKGLEVGLIRRALEALDD